MRNRNARPGAERATTSIAAAPIALELLPAADKVIALHPGVQPSGANSQSYRQRLVRSARQALSHLI
jgi:hypothetical protein